ncbi:MAG: energy transducer TonB [Pseudomonadota bacterium]
MTSLRTARIIDLAAARAHAHTPVLADPAAEQRPAASRRIAVWVAVSLLLHALALALPAAWFERPEFPSAPRPLDVVLVTVSAATPAADSAPAQLDQPVAVTQRSAPAPLVERRSPPPVPKPRPRPAPIAAEPPPPPEPAPAEAVADAAPPEPTPSARTAPAVSAPARSAGAPSAPVAAAPAASPREAPLVPPSLSADYLDNPPPPYPLSARRLGQSGLVLLRVRVTEAGKPAEVRIARSAGVEALDRAAQEAVRGWTFVPARRGDVAVAAWVEVPVRFRLDDAR